MGKGEIDKKAIDALPYRRCVGLVLMNREGLIFAGKRIDNPGDAWQMPQGGIDKGEEPQQAVLRELGEETGIAPERVEVIRERGDWLSYDLPYEIVPKIWKGRYRGQQQKWFLLRFLGEDHEVRIDGEHPEFSEWRWLTAHDLVEKIVPFKRQTYEMVFQDFFEEFTPR